MALGAILVGILVGLTGFVVALACGLGFLVALAVYVGTGLLVAGLLVVRAVLTDPVPSQVQPA